MIRSLDSRRCRAVSPKVRLLLVKSLYVTAALLLLAPSAKTQTVGIPNPSFEEGTRRPAGWTLAGCPGRWLKRDAAAGRRAIQVSGNGRDSGYWRSASLFFRPSSLYVVRFRARMLEGTGGTPISGPVFCNRDLGMIPSDWETYESIFFTPRGFAGDDWIRFGQWQLDGAVAYDDVEIMEAIPIYERRGPLELGAGERISGVKYSFEAPFYGESRNHSRPLSNFLGGFNTDRWVLSAGGEVVYCHFMEGYNQKKARFSIEIPWYQSGKLSVDVHVPGLPWRPIGEAAQKGRFEFSVPEDMLPAQAVWIRLSAQAAERLGPESDPGSLQIGAYSYRSELVGEPVEMTGSTRFVFLRVEDPVVRVTVESLGDARPGGDNFVELKILNTRARVTPAMPVVTIMHEGKKTETRHRSVPLRPVPSPALLRNVEHLRLPYQVIRTGDYLVKVELRGLARYGMEFSFRVPPLFDSSYGRLLPGSGKAAAVWCASSGWKVSRGRPAPEAAGDALLIRAAGDEAEAAQMVVSPKEELRSVLIEATDLEGPGDAALPAGSVEILKVEYVDIQFPTDQAGAVGAWPDPLPPIESRMDLEADRNYPFWIRVKPPAGTPAGLYRGWISIRAKDFHARVPLHVEVYGFTLPKRMTLTSAFGFSPGNIWRYQNIQDPAERRQVLDLYLKNLADHHISPYNPAPLDPIEVAWSDTAEGDPEPEFDWTRWDAEMERVLNRYHFNSFTVPIQGLGGGTFHARTEPNLLGYGENTPQYRKAFKAYCSKLENHLREKGWLDRAFIYWFDEPAPKDYPFVANGFEKLREAAPAIRRMITEPVEPALAGGPDIWCPVSSELDPNAARKRQKKGEKIWWYICTQPKAPYAGEFIDHSGTEMRVWLWQTWKRGLDGILIWQTNYWTSDWAYPEAPQDPYADPMSWVSGYGTAVGTRDPWGNGDGRFIYPPVSATKGGQTKPILKGPVDSIRFEMLRDGIEDYEYLAILRRLLDKKGKGLSRNERKQYRELLEVPDAISRDLTDFTLDPEPIEARRHQIARAIEALSRL